jgi:hypothetical protein
MGLHRGILGHPVHKLALLNLYLVSVQHPKRRVNLDRGSTKELFLLTATRITVTPKIDECVGNQSN